MPKRIVTFRIMEPDILKFFDSHRNFRYTAQQVASETGYNIQYVADLLRKLVKEERLIQVIPSGKGKVGRPQHLYAFPPTTYYTVEEYVSTKGWQKADDTEEYTQQEQALRMAVSILRDEWKFPSDLLLHAREALAKGEIIRDDDADRALQITRKGKAAS